MYHRLETNFHRSLGIASREGKIKETKDRERERERMRGPIEAAAAAPGGGSSPKLIRSPFISLFITLAIPF